MVKKPARNAHRTPKGQANGGARIKMGMVSKFLGVSIWRREEVQITELFGEIDYDPEYDYKKHRLWR